MSLIKAGLSTATLQIVSPQSPAHIGVCAPRPRLCANASLPSRIAVVGDYLPRQCGIATFTTDLCEAMAGELNDGICFAMPVNDTEDGYAYPPRVRFELVENDPESYRCAADFLNLNNVDL